MGSRAAPSRLLGGLARSRFARNVATVASGTAAAQAITMAFSPVITRLYGPAAFGVFGTFTAVMAVTTLLAALSYPIAIVLPESDGDALGLARLSLLVAAATSALVALLLALFGGPITALLELEAIGALVFLLPVAMLFAASGAVVTQWVIRKRLFELKAKVDVAQSLLVNGAKAGIGLFHPVAAVLVVAASLGYLLQAVLLLAGIRIRGGAGEAGRRSAPSSSLWTLAKRHRDFPLYRAPQSFLNATTQSLPIVMLASLFGPAPAGFYTLGRMVLRAPTGLIAGSVMSVFYPRVNEAVLAGQSASDLIRRASGALALVGLVPFGAVAVAGPWLFALVFGAEWVVAGEYARWLAIWSYVGLINRPSVAAIPVLSLQGHFLVYEMVSIVVRVAALAAGFFVFASDMAAVALFSGAGVLLNAYLIFATLRTARRMERGAAAAR